MGFLKGDPTEDKEIIEAYLGLKKRLVREHSAAYAASVPKVVWKTAGVYQCLIRRTLEAADGMRAAWNSGNLLTAITMARSLIETGAVVRHLTDAIKKSVADKNTETLDRAVMNVGFGTRIDDLYDGAVEKGKEDELKALNVLTTINKMDKAMFPKKEASFRKSYDFLSEFAHPNTFGIMGLYSDNFPKKYRVEFGNVAGKKKNILSSLRVTLAMIWLVDIAARDIDALIPAISEFVPK